MNISELRRDLRLRRQSLSREQQLRASLAITASINALDRYRRASRIAAYVGSKGEIDPMPLLYLAHDMGKQCFLPVLHPFLPGRLWFVPWTPGTPMQFNRFNIPEPVFDAQDICKPQWLDIIITPLLGFDEQCHRLGMGGGFYDRTLARTHMPQRTDKPFLIGVAHDIQRCKRLPVQPWDVSLDYVITPGGSYHCKGISNTWKTRTL